MKFFGKDEEPTLAKAVINHSKEFVQEVKLIWLQLITI